MTTEWVHSLKHRISFYGAGGLKYMMRPCAVLCAVCFAQNIWLVMANILVSLMKLQ